MVNDLPGEAQTSSRACDSDSREPEKHHGVEALRSIRFTGNDSDGRVKYHDGRCEIDCLGREVCDGSLKSD